MNRILNKLERKFGKYAISNLIAYLLFGYAAGYVLHFFAVDAVPFLTLEPREILRGQVWRLFTWILMPPEVSPFFAMIMMLLYYQLGQSLERIWGTFRFNVYVFGGIFFTILGAFALYGISCALGFPDRGIGWYFSTDYINQAIFLAYAAYFPNERMYLYFIIPIKMKWLAIFYAISIFIQLIGAGWAGRVAILMSILNFLIFYLSTRDYHRISPKEIHRKQAFRSQMRNAAKSGITKHKCAICGRTDEDDPDLEFRFCSKCEGNYEYCQDHLFTHQHIKRS